MNDGSILLSSENVWKKTEIGKKAVLNLLGTITQPRDS